MVASTFSKKARRARKQAPAPLAANAIVHSEWHTAIVHSVSSDPHSGFIAAIYKGMAFVRYHYLESSLRDIMQTLDAR